MLKIGVLVSGGGTNLQAIIDNINNGFIKNTKIVSVVASKNGVFALERARLNDIDSCVISKKEFSNINNYDEALVSHFSKLNVDLIVMAGFLSILGEKFNQYYQNKIINIHPSLIPAFCGKGFYGIIPHQKALEYGVKVVGATVHFVSVEADAGPIILQKAIEVKQTDTAETLQKRVMEEAEQLILPEAVKLFVEGRLEVVGRKVIIHESKREVI